MADGCTNDDATEDTDIERAGLAGRAGAKVDGEAGKELVPCSEGRLDIAGAAVETGVAFGVECCDETDVLIADGPAGAGVFVAVARAPW